MARSAHGGALLGVPVSRSNLVCSTGLGASRRAVRGSQPEGESARRENRFSGHEPDAFQMARAEDFAGSCQECRRQIGAGWSEDEPGFTYKHLVRP